MSSHTKRTIRFQDNLKSEHPLGGMHILVVEDLSDTREIIKFVLERAGARVSAVDSFAPAVEKLSGDRPDFVVTDIGMPEFDGYALFSKIKEYDEANGLRTPTIAVTALATPFDRERALEMGFDAYVAKPFDPAELIQIIAVAAVSRAA